MDVAREGEARFRVLTFNTANDFMTPDNLETVLEARDVAIAGLQELGRRNAAALEERLLDRFPYRAIHGERINGKALLSRFPMHDVEWFSLPSGRPYLEARLTIAGVPVQVVVAHLPPGDYRRLQTVHPYAGADLELLLGRIDTAHPAILMGDFNVISRSQNYRRVRRMGLIDTFRAAGRGTGPTFPMRHSHAPIPLPRLIRIDYIWVTRHFEPVWSAVAPSLGSDHAPVISEVRLRRFPADVMSAG